MFINFDDVAIFRSLGIDYFSHSTNKLQPLSETKYSSLFNQWLPYEGGSGADVRCQIVHIGKRLEGNTSRLRIAVYHEHDRMETLMLFPINAIDTAITCMYSEAGRGDLVCVE